MHSKAPKPVPRSSAGVVLPEAVVAGTNTATVTHSVLQHQTSGILMPLVGPGSAGSGPGRPDRAGIAARVGLLTGRP
ncbi:hypothetical protein I0C86_02510 [Plantactinospora sp. S1510]|uniref:Uncharacterized protein n=1 Tax=Plantactinospora alkalitolerans TaxID=2789879 RepID=A0ABS0GNV6_9ACTN|nr:hypothetical protein [Plantactinospora alkalitolerans]